MRTSIPTSFKLPPNYGVQKIGVDPEVKTFAQMTADFNKGSIVSCIITNIISKPGEIPAWEFFLTKHEKTVCDYGFHGWVCLAEYLQCKWENIYSLQERVSRLDHEPVPEKDRSTSRVRYRWCKDFLRIIINRMSVRVVYKCMSWTRYGLTVYLWRATSNLPKSRMKFCTNKLPRWGFAVWGLDRFFLVRALE
jgi:hypothetical protein